MKIVYIHGFNSAYDPNSEKLKPLTTLGTVSGITYDSFGTYDDIFNDILGKLEYSDDLVLVGTSLGGFWAATIAKHLCVPSVIINPCTDPYNMLTKYIGFLTTNYMTAETNVLTTEAVNTYRSYELCDKHGGFYYKPLVLLDMGDEVIDSFKTRDTLVGFPMVYYPDGSHRFEHMEDAVNKIKEHLNYYSIIEDLNT